MMNWIIYAAIAIVTLISLMTDDTLQMTVLSSTLFGEEFQKKYKLVLQIGYAFVWPITLPYILYLSTKTNNLMRVAIKLISVILLAILVKSIVVNTIDYYNKSVGYELKLKKNTSERLVILDRVTKIVYQKLQLAKINDSSYYKNLTAVAFMRKDGEQLAWKWIQENNPNANYGEVSSFYRDVSSSIQSERDNLMEVERKCQDVVYEYESTRQTWPGKLFLYYKPLTLDYKPISTSDNKLTNKTGIDDKIGL